MFLEYLPYPFWRDAYLFSYVSCEPFRIGCPYCQHLLSSSGRHVVALLLKDSDIIWIL